MDLLDHNYPLFGFENRQIPELLSWIKTPSDLGYWAGNTFKKGLSPLIFSRHLERKDLTARMMVDTENRLLAYGEIVKMSSRLCSFCRIAIRPDARGSGLGKKFCGSLIEWVKFAPGHEEIMLNTLSSNHAALACYTGIGFKMISRKKKARLVDGIKQDIIKMNYLIRK